jgi:cytochrome c553
MHTQNKGRRRMPRRATRTGSARFAGALRICRILSCVGIGTLTATPSFADSKKISYGKHLASECTSCHRIDGVDNGIPSITGWDVADFAQTMAWYKDGARDNQAMRSVAQSLDVEQIEALASFFQTIPKPAKRKK